MKWFQNCTLKFFWTFLFTAAAAKSLQSCPTLCDPIDGSPPGSTIPGILQARTLEYVAISFSNSWEWKVKVKSLSCVRLLATPWTVAHQAPSSTGFSRQEYWSGVPLPSPCMNLKRSKFYLWQKSEVWLPMCCAGELEGGMGDIRGDVNILLCAVLSQSVVSNSLWRHGLWAHQAPLSMGILQARILEWVAIFFSRGSSWPRDWTLGFLYCRQIR